MNQNRFNLTGLDSVKSPFKLRFTVLSLRLYRCIFNIKGRHGHPTQGSVFPFYTTLITSNKGRVIKSSLDNDISRSFITEGSIGYVKSQSNVTSFVISSLFIAR
jgi:hypothetical protein